MKLSSSNIKKIAIFPEMELTLPSPNVPPPPPPKKKNTPPKNLLYFQK